MRQQCQEPARCSVPRPLLRCQQSIPASPLRYPSSTASPHPRCGTPTAQHPRCRTPAPPWHSNPYACRCPLCPCHGAPLSWEKRGHRAALARSGITLGGGGCPCSHPAPQWAQPTQRCPGAQRRKKGGCPSGVSAALEWHRPAGKVVVGGSEQRQRGGQLDGDTPPCWWGRTWGKS